MVAFCGVIEHDAEYDFDPRSMQRLAVFRNVLISLVLRQRMPPMRGSL